MSKDLNRKPPVEKNQEIELVISDLGIHGEGIGRYKGFTVMVPGLLPGEQARVKILQVRSGFAYGKLLRVEKASRDRIEPSCPLDGRCGGCQLGHLSYRGQLAYKHDKVRQDLIRIGHFDEETVEAVMQPATLGMPEGEDGAYGWLHYRNKAQFPVQTVDGRAEAGFFAPRSHRLLPTEDCRIQSERANELIQKIMARVNELGLSVYDEETHSGLLRHVLIRTAEETSQVSVCFVINGTTIPDLSLWCDFLKQEKVDSFSLNTNRQNTNVILGDKTVTVYGPYCIEDTMDGLRFRISPASFYQVNSYQMKVLYRQALELAKLTGKETVWDAYCGIGTISLFLARKAGKVYAVEIVPDAIRDANENAALNQIDNVTFFTGKAEEVIPDQYEKNGVRADVMVVDPPRSGCEKPLLDTFLQMQPDRIVYVSCDPATLARDLDILCHGEGTYELKEVRTVDLFPNTIHVETVVLLSKGSIDSQQIKVEFSLEDMDITSFRGKATYEQVKEYIQQQTGMKVSSLYISQVKRKCGLKVGENYNKPKTEDAKQPQCPPEKEAAIMDALKHFGLI